MFSKPGRKFITEHRKYKRVSKICLIRGKRPVISRLVTKYSNGIPGEKIRANMASLTIYGKALTSFNLPFIIMHFFCKRWMVQTYLGVLSMAGCSNIISAETSI